MGQVFSELYIDFSPLLGTAQSSGPVLLFFVNLKLLFLFPLTVHGGMQRATGLLKSRAGN